jgi:hypothetical protein
VARARVVGEGGLRPRSRGGETARVAGDGAAKVGGTYDEAGSGWAGSMLISGLTIGGGPGGGGGVGSTDRVPFRPEELVYVHFKKGTDGAKDGYKTYHLGWNSRCLGPDAAHKDWHPMHTAHSQVRRVGAPSAEDPEVEVDSLAVHSRQQLGQERTGQHLVEVGNWCLAEDNLHQEDRRPLSEEERKTPVD